MRGRIYSQVGKTWIRLLPACVSARGVSALLDFANVESADSHSIPCQNSLDSSPGFYVFHSFLNLLGGIRSDQLVDGKFVLAISG